MSYCTSMHHILAHYGRCGCQTIPSSTAVSVFSTFYGASIFSWSSFQVRTLRSLDWPCNIDVTTANVHGSHNIRAQSGGVNVHWAVHAQLNVLYISTDKQGEALFLKFHFKIKENCNAELQLKLHFVLDRFVKDKTEIHF